MQSYEVVAAAAAAAAVSPTAGIFARKASHCQMKQAGGWCEVSPGAFLQFQTLLDKKRKESSTDA